MIKKKKKKKEVTLDGLALLIKDGFVKSDKRTDNKIEALAGIVQRGFSDLGAEIKQVQVSLENRMDGIKKQMVTLEHGQEDIKLSLNNVAYRFELKQLEERVSFLERKMTKA